METLLIKEKQDLRYLHWSRIRNSSGTAGSFLKAWSELEGTKIYYKLSNYDNILGVIGHESVNELIVDRLLNILGVEHLHYQLVHAAIVLDGKEQDTYICASENFRSRDEDKQSIDICYASERVDGETPLDFCLRKGWSKYIWEMLVVDFLILNRDRHGANIEVLRNKKKKSLRLAPLFDHGLSLLCRCSKAEEIEKFDVMEDRQVQCFVGSRSAQDNLKLIPVDELPTFNPLQLSDKDVLLEGLEDILSPSLRTKIWDMLWQRWCYYEAFCNSRRNG